MPIAHLTPLKRIFVVCFFVCISLLSGYIGGIFAQQLPSFEDSGTRPFIIEKTGVKKIENSLDAFYERVNPMTVKIVDANSSQWISDSDILSYGIILTNDGWIASTSILNDPSHELFAVRSDGITSRIIQRIKDPATSIQYLRMEGNGFQSVDFLNDEESHQALMAFAFFPNNHIKRLITVRRWYPPSNSAKTIIQSSDILQKVYPVEGNAQKKGAPVFSENGQLIGIIGELGIIPSLYIQNGLKFVLKTGTIDRITLNIPYIDVSFSHSISSKKMNGARIVTDKQIALMTKQGKVVVVDGDVITKVNDEDVDENRSLSELLQEYTRDDHIILTVVSKKGEERHIEILLK